VFLGLDCKDPLPVRLVGQINAADFVRAPDDDEFDSAKVLVMLCSIWETTSLSWYRCSATAAGRWSRKSSMTPACSGSCGRHRGGQLLGGTGAAHRPSRARRDDTCRRCASGHQHDHAQRLLVLGHDRRAGPAGAGRCRLPWVCLRSCRVCARLSGARTTIRSTAGPDQDLHDRQEHDHEQQRPDQP
jgi:hypothetical protein